MYISLLVVVIVVTIVIIVLYIVLLICVTVAFLMAHKPTLIAYNTVSQYCM